MQNTYAGPPQDFAMVVPVPVVLHEANVKVLPPEVFEKVDQLTAPRLVEYWEQDPCRPQVMYDMAPAGAVMSAATAAPAEEESAERRHVKIEARFAVGEYDVVVLSAQDSTGLDGWLHDNHYKIPDGAEPYLRPYVQMGMKFFVAKVNVAKVKFERVGNGPEHAVLSPLRFHYDTPDFFLPVRLGLINSGGKQDLIAVVLARTGSATRSPTTTTSPCPRTSTSPTRCARSSAAFYASLFDRVVANNPRAVVTEYSWESSSCDPCPTPPLDDGELATLGADVLPDNGSTAAARSSSRACTRATPRTRSATICASARPTRHRRRPRGPGHPGAARAAHEQLPGALRHPPQVDRGRRLREPRLRRVGRAARRPRPEHDAGAWTSPSPRATSTWPRS